MAFAPHPYRILDLPRLEEIRAFRVEHEVKSAVSTPGRKTQKELSAIDGWFERREADRMPAAYNDLFRTHQSTLSGVAAAVVDIDRFVPDIYDVSELVDKFHDQDISGFSLARLTSGTPIKYIHLGPRADTIIDADAGIYIEGAYIRQFDVEVDGDEKSEFHILLVCNDPAFDTSWDRPFMQTLKANTRMIWGTFRASETVGQSLDSLQSISGFFEGNFKENFQACRNAFDAVIKSMIYLDSSNEPDRGIGCAADANPVLEANARGGDEYARMGLIANGTPLVVIVGRNVSWVPKLDQPDYDRDDDDEDDNEIEAVAVALAL